MRQNEYFRYVVKNSNLLVLGDNSLSQFEDVFKAFKNKYFQEATQHNVDSLSSSITELDISLVVITAYDNGERLFKLLSVIKTIKNIHILYCLSLEKTQICEKLINISDTVFTDIISEDNLVYKLFNSLNDVAAVSHINCEQGFPREDKKESYRDAFDAEVMFICEDLRDIAKSIDSGDISKDIFNRLILIISKVSHIVNGYLMSSQTILNLINDFNEYLQNFDLENIDISALEGFEHLSRLIEDIAVFLDKYFIAREIDNIYVVEDSLKNSFEFVKLVFEGNQNTVNDDDGSSMEFFE